MRNPWLKEQLLDDSEVEVPTWTPSEAEEVELEEDIRKLRLDYPAETYEERELRLSNVDRVDGVVIVAYAIVVALSVISCSITMLIFDITVTGFLFALSIITGPLLLYQRLQLIKSKSKREAIAKLWSDTISLKQTNNGLEASMAAMDKDIQSLRSTLSRYKALMKGYDVSGITDMYHENERINEQKKLLAEAIGIEKLRKNILSTDVNKDHYVGDAELSLLATRMEINEGIPFSSDELCNRFKLEETRNLRTLANAAQTLYIEKRREQAVKRASEEIEKTPRNLGTPMLWKRQIDGIGISV